MPLNINAPIEVAAGKRVDVTVEENCEFVTFAVDGVIIAKATILDSDAVDIAVEDLGGHITE